MIDAVDISIGQIDQISAIALQVEQTLTCVATEALFVVVEAHNWTERLEWINMFETTFAFERVELLAKTLHECAVRSDTLFSDAV